MKVLIDENLPERLYYDFSIHKAVTVTFMGWKGKENDSLIKLMIENGFEVLVTLDKNLQYQQNFKNYNIIVVVIHTQKTGYPSIKPLVNQVEILLNRHPENGVYIIEAK